MNGDSPPISNEETTQNLIYFVSTTNRSVYHGAEDKFQVRMEKIAFVGGRINKNPPLRRKAFNEELLR